jgi:drug/metabolite transporter (DMT)-like permease
MIGIVLALLSAATSGISVVFVRKYSANSSVFNMSLIITFVGMLILWPIAFSATNFGSISLIGFLFFAVSGVLSPGLVRLFYYKGLKNLGASANSSIFAIYPLYSSLLAVILLNEMPTMWNMLGIAAIIVGVILVEFTVDSKNGQGTRSWKNLAPPIIGSLTLGASMVIRKFALDTSNVPVFGVATAYLFSLFPYIIILAFSPSTRQNLSLKQDVRWFWVAGVGQAVSWLLAFYALSFETVAITTPLLSVEPLFVVSFAYFYLKKVEHVSAKLLASVAITVLGIVLITI